MLKSNGIYVETCLIIFSVLELEKKKALVIEVCTN